MAKAKNKTVFVGLSGGVDSSVAAALLKKQGYDVVGVHLRCFNVDGCEEGDAEDARRVAEHLEIPFYVFDFEEEYKKRVVEYMIEGYRAGITPNPDVMCNREIKFGLFFEKAMRLGADYIATGHYVRLRELRESKFVLSHKPPHVKIKLARTLFATLPRLRSGGLAQRRGSLADFQTCSSNIRSSEFAFHLFEAKDKNKDQSYFLWTLTQEQLQHCLFPIGDYLKSEVRAIARKLKLPTAEKKDSQGICFLGKVSIKDFLKKYIKEKPGIILTTQGKKVGEHKGIYFYTIGQRQGLDLKNLSRILKKKGDTKPFYIAEKDEKSNTLIIAEEGDKALSKKEVQLTNINIINNQSLIRANKRMDVMARIRYRQPLAKATLLQIRNPKSEIRNRMSQVKSYKSLVTSYTLVFDKPQQFVAEGQSAVFYTKKGEMLGGGVIR